MDLNEMQQKAILNNNSNLRIIAGAGTGKTLVITQKFIHLCNNLSYKPERLLAITFTNKAANEMYDRIKDSVNLNRKQSSVLTFHAFCLKILRKNIDKLTKINVLFNVIDETDKKNYIKLFFKENKVKYERSEIKQISALISFWKITNYKSDNYKDYINDIQEDLRDGNFEIKKEAFKFYQNKLLNNNQIDYDDILIYAYHLLMIDDIRIYWQSQFDYIFVDEFQDTDLIQYSILKFIYSSKSKITVVGDPDQNIYSWRKSDIKYILNFHNDFPNVETIVLTKNYRSTPEILKLANNLIDNNEQRYKKKLISTRLKNEVPIIYEFNKSSEEIKSIVNKIKELKTKKYIDSYSDVMILYRINSQSSIIEKELLKNNISYLIYGGHEFFQRLEIKRITNLLRFLTCGDDFSFSSFLLTLPGIGQKTIQKLTELAEQENLSILKLILTEGLLFKSNIKFCVELYSYIKVLVRAIENINDFEDPVKYLNEIIIEFNIFKEYQKELENGRIENILALFDMLYQFSNINYELSGIELFYEFLLDLNLFQDKNNYDGTKKQKESLILSTIHKAKGLESKVIFIFNLANSIFPAKSKISKPEDLEEERRLLFVGLTRARDYLFISFNKDFSYLTNDYFSESVFIKELSKKNYRRIKDDEIKFENMLENSLINHPIYGIGKLIEKTEKYLLVNFKNKIIKIPLKNHLIDVLLN